MARTEPILTSSLTLASVASEPGARGVFQVIHGLGTSRMEQIACPNCGEPIADLARLREIIGYCKELWGQCSCGLKYRFTVSLGDDVVLIIPDRQLEIVC
jgi:hypothetical protein